ncbi:hypothetical protein [Legionella nagasakiensis]|uniref:hypothetical protein n=1 Tax=Legionella nagasakiensis TaxID=535290 RepID=UPI0010568839|nr:hypothetical protein [Legionella nagasakiensis]
MNTTQDKIANPLNYYKKPIEVEQDRTLSVAEKIKLLTNWLDDINLRQIAEAENMQAKDNGRTYIADVERLLHKYQTEQPGRH